MLTRSIGLFLFVTRGAPEIYFWQLLHLGPFPPPEIKLLLLLAYLVEKIKLYSYGDNKLVRSNSVFIPLKLCFEYNFDLRLYSLTVDEGSGKEYKWLKGVSNLI